MFFVSGSETLIQLPHVASTAVLGLVYPLCMYVCTSGPGNGCSMARTQWPQQPELNAPDNLTSLPRQADE